MRKSHREIRDMSSILSLIERIDTIRLGLMDKPWPYVVPVSFGFAMEADTLSFFFHGAPEGQKATLLQADPHVCIEGDLCHGFRDTGRSVTCLYESFIAFGTAALLEGEDKIHGLERLLEHCGFAGHSIHAGTLPRTNVYQVRVAAITAKHRTLDN